MPLLKDLRFGSLAAESDADLFDYFVVTPAAETIVRERIGLVLGRKGSGKTALFRQGEELLGQFGRSDVRVVRLNMDDHSWAAFQDFKTLGLSPEHAATVSWQLALLLQLAVALTTESSLKWSSVAFDDVQVLRQFIGDNFGEVSPDLAKSSSLIGQLTGLKVGAFGASLETSFRPGVAPRDLVPGIADAINQRLRGPLRESGWVVLLDQLDESWDGSEDKRQLLVGLLKAVKRVNDDYGWDNGVGESTKGARAIAFLRTDIYEALDFDDKVKFRDTVVEIRWSNDQLRDMLQQRLGDTSVDDIFETRTAQRKGRIPKGSFNYLVSRTFMRPRDLLQFLLQLKTEHGSAERITKELVDATEVTYSRNKVDDLRQEYRRGAPWITLALDALKQGPNKFDSRRELEERLESKVSSAQLATLGMSILDLVDWLVEISVLGAAPRQVTTQSIRFRCEGDAVSLEGDSTAWIHPALFRGLALAEPRASRVT